MNALLKTCCVCGCQEDPRYSNTELVPFDIEGRLICSDCRYVNNKYSKRHADFIEEKDMFEYLFTEYE